MVIASARYELRIPAASSLKDKRQVIRGLIERLRNRYNLSVAEVADQDQWRKATIGVACVSSTQHHARHLIDIATRHVEGCLEIEIARVAVDFFSDTDE
ncbi:MAG: DUF503 domain-containing protein [Actinobacteria bacterium]|nr:MAG: DUF503 domain-containing protein [Actinomycetota bacterium]